MYGIYKYKYRKVLSFIDTEYVGIKKDGIPYSYNYPEPF